MLANAGGAAQFLAIQDQTTQLVLKFDQEQYAVTATPYLVPAAHTVHAFDRHFTGTMSLLPQRQV